MWTSPGWWGTSCCSKHGHRTRTEARPLRPFTQTGVCLCCIGASTVYCMQVSIYNNIQIYIASLTYSTSITHRRAQETSWMHICVFSLCPVSCLSLSLAFAPCNSYIFCVKTEKVLFACFLLPLRFLECLLRQASNALIIHCPTMRCFVNQKIDSEPSFRADEFSDVSGRSQSLITVI